MKTTFDRISAMSAEQRDKLSEQFEKASRVAGAEPIAVVGIGCRFPGGVTGPDSYWTMLESGTNAVTEVPADRWDGDAYYDPDPMAPGRMPSKWGAYIDDMQGFDAEFFGITPREAAAMDPQQRVVLEVAYEALENAGLAPDTVGEIRGAVMLGVYYNEYQSASAGNPDTIDAYSATGNAHSVTVGRIAYLLGLKGPAVAVDTACSSSLVSIHLACQSLRMRESDLALAGGVSLSLRPETQLALGKWGMLSPHGKCYAFDSRANGFVRGEGAGVVVLKRLTDAVRDGDRVLGVVRGSAVNQDGRSNGLTAPNAPSQRDVIARALRSADVAAGTVNYVETHGTGTSLGDPIEFDALAAVYGKGESPCALGAVKTNMGHLEAAAGIAGFIKTVLTLQHGAIAPNLHFEKWNPTIDPSSTRLFVPTEKADWPRTEHPRRAAVSSFGMGGTNAHIVLEQGPEPVDAPAAAPTVQTLVVSGKTPARVAASAASLADWLDGAGASAPLRDVAFTVNHHRSRHHTIATVSARTNAEAVTGLRALAAGQQAAGVVGAHDAKVSKASEKGVVFLYSGQGAQWAGMGKTLLAEEPAFAAAVDELEPAFLDKVGFSLRQTLEAGEPVTGIDRIQPVLVGMQLALTQLWRSYGVEPDAVIGHSMGEATAAVVAGALTPAEGFDVIATRTRLMKRLSGQGAMALLELDAQAAEKLIADRPDVTIAVYASPKQCVVAGPPEQVDELIAIVDGQGKLARRVEVDVASHHPTIDPVLPELKEALAYLRPAAPKIPLVSTVAYTGSAPLYSADYWAANLRNPVRFSQAVHEASAENSNFIEISPHPLLAHAISDTLAAQSTNRRFHVGATVNRDHPETLAFHAQLAAVAPPAVKAPEDADGRLVSVPATAWQHTAYWMADRSANQQFAGAHPLLGLHVELPSGSGHVWQSDVGLDAHPWLADHIVHGLPVMPGAGFAEIALAAAREALDLPATGVEVAVEVQEMLPLDEHTKLTTQVSRGEDGALSVEIHSRSEAGTWTRHAAGTLRAAEPATPAKPGPLGDGSPVSPSDFYTALRRTGAHHAHAFAALTRIVRADRKADTEIVLPDEATPHRGVALHPVMLDAALQGLAAAMGDETLSDSNDVTYLPVGFGSVRVFGEIGRRAKCRAELVSVAEDSGDAVGRVTLTDETGTVLAQVDNVALKRIQRRTVPLPLSQKIFDSRWAVTQAPSGGTATGSWLVLAGGADNLAAAQRFAQSFSGPQRHVETADLADEAAARDGFAAATSDAALPPAGVVVLVDVPEFDGADADADAHLTAAQDAMWEIAATVRTIVGSWHGKPPRLWVVTRGGLVVGDSDGGGNPGVGSLKALIRVLAYEHPDLKTTLLDVGADGDVAAILAAEIEASGSAADTEDVIAWRDGARLVERLSRAKLPATPGRLVVRGDGSYVVTGALGGVGLAVVRWLVDNGAGRLVLNGRSAASPEAQAVLDELSHRAEISVVTGDIAATGTAQRLVAAAEETGRPLRGVIHSAAVLDDELVVGLTRESVERIWAPKAAGAWRLHEATVGKELDWWVGFSSVASLLGSPGQSAYACANAWLDALVAWRTAAGLPAITVNWGQWADVGLASSLRFSVLDPISPDEGVDALGGVLAAGLSRVGIARLRLDRAAAAFPEIRQIGFFADLVGELDVDDADDDWEGAEALKGMDAAEVNRVVVARLRRRIAGVMGYSDDSAVDTAKPLTEMGLDSLMAVRMRNTIRGDFGVEPPVALLLQGATLSDVALDLIRQLGLAEEDSSERPNALRDRAQQRAAARQRAASRRKVGPRS